MRLRVSAFLHRLGRPLRRGLRSRYVWLVAGQAALAARVLIWLAPGASPDGSNSFSPLMPELSPFLAGAYPWNPTSENGFPNPQVPRFLENTPQYLLSDLGFSTWSAQVTWLFFLYLVGALCLALAVAELFPGLRARFWPILVAGFAYQLSPSLMFGLQDTAAYGLQVGTYWALPLLLFLVLRAERTREWWWTPLIGAAVLLALTEFPATVVPLALFGAFLLVLVIRRARGRLGVRPLWPLVVASVGWMLVFNAWWAIPEFTYRGDLLQNLALNTPISLNYPDHLGNLLVMDWEWPAPSGYLAYLRTPGAILGGAAIFLTCLASFLPRERIPGRGPLAVLWAVTLVLVYGAASPFSGTYQLLFGSTVFANLVRNSVHFVPLFDVATAALFALGAEWIVDGPIGTWLAKRMAGLLSHEGPKAEPEDSRPSPTRRHRLPVRAVAGTVGFTALLVLASYPLISGGVLEDVNFNGHVVTAVSPPQIGVRVPGDYYEARSWLADRYPQTTTMVVPMPSTWLSADSNLSWGYEGSSAIYETLLQEPLITNNAGTLTAPAFPAISAAYSIAAGGGPPANASDLPMNSSLCLWPGFTRDSVQYAPDTGPNGSLAIAWSMFLGQDYGINGHQFTWTVPSPLPSDTRYLGFWVDPETPGELEFSWAINTTLAGWYVIATSGAGWQFIVVPLASPPTFNYAPTVLSTDQVASATDFWFEFHPSGPLVNGSGVVRLAQFTVYGPDPSGLTYYLASLGVHLVVVDRSIVAEPGDPLQNLSSYGALLSALSPDRAASFGNLTIYDLAPALPVVVGAGAWTNASNFYTAWDSRSSPLPVFVNQPPPWLPERLATPQIQASSIAPGEYRASVTTPGPFLLVVLQNFDPLWQASIGGVVLTTHLTVNGFANGWLINRSGNFTVFLEFGPDSTYITVLEWTPILAVPFVLVTAAPLRARVLATLRRLRIRRDQPAPAPN